MDGTRIIKLGPPKEQEIVEIIEVVNLALPMETKAAKGDYELAFGAPAPIATKPVTFEEAFGKHTPEKSGDDNCISVTAPLIETKSNAAGFQAPARPTFNPVASAQAAKASTPVASATTTPVTNPAVAAQVKTLLAQVQQASAAAQTAAKNAKTAQNNAPSATSPNAKAGITSAKQATATAKATAFQQANIARTTTNQILTLLGKPTLPALKAPKANSFNPNKSNPSSLGSQYGSASSSATPSTPKVISVAQAGPASPGTIPASRFEGESNFSGEDFKKPGLNATKVVLGLALVGIGYIAYKKSK